MQITVFSDLNTSESFDFPVDNVRDALLGLKLVKGLQFYKKIIENKYKYLFETSNKEFIALHGEVITTPLPNCERLLIIPEISGEIQAAFIAPYLGVAATSAYAAAAAMAINLVISIAISLAVSAIMSALSPTVENKADPAQKKNSLWNNPYLIQQEGGVIPLAYGNCFAGGLVISSAIATGDTRYPVEFIPVDVTQLTNGQILPIDAVFDFY